MPTAHRGPVRPFASGRAPLLAFATTVLGLGLILGSLLVPSTFAAPSTSVSVSNAGGTIVDPAGFPTAAAAYLTSGGCAVDAVATTLPDGDWTLLVTTADGDTALSTDAATERGVHVVAGRIVSATGDHATTARACPDDPLSGPDLPLTVALAPFDTGTAGAGVYRLAVAPTEAVEGCLASGDATGFGCPGLALRSTTFTVAGSAAASLTASVADATVDPGVSVVDQAALTASGTTPTGTIVFYVCVAATCPTGGQLVGSADLQFASATSPAFTTAAPGTYSFRAEYWGDATYAAVNADGGGQTFTVGTSTAASSSAGSSAAPGSIDPSAAASAATSPSASAVSSAAPSGSTAPGSTAPGATPTPGAPGPTTPASTPRPSTAPTATWTPYTGPIKTGTPPPPPAATPTPPDTIPVNNGPCGGKPVCYAVSPTFFGPGYDYPIGGSAKPVLRTLTAFGPGGPNGDNGSAGQTTAGEASAGGGAPAGGGTPAGGGVTDTALPSGGVAGATGAVGSIGSEATATITAIGTGIAVLPPTVQALGAGASGAGVSSGAAEAAGGIGSETDAPVAAGPIGAAPQSAGALTLVLLALLVLGVVAAAWIVRSRGRHRLRS